MTATVQASEAADRLREVIKPGGTVWNVSHGFTRSGVEKISLHATPLSTITEWVAKVTGDRLIRDTPYLGFGNSTHDPADDFRPLLDRLSMALFGEPGQIKGGYL